MSEPILKVTDLSRNFDGIKAVSDLSFVVQPGEIKAVIGPNGAGKSTLFNMIAGVTPPSTGEIHFQGQRIDALPTAKRAQMGIARTFQNLQIFPEMTVLENVMAGRHMSGDIGMMRAILRLPATVAEERRISSEAMELLGRFGLKGLATTRAGDLSFGQSKILELARALACDPTLLLLDEPAAGLPHAEADEMSRVIRELNADGMTVVLVEHNMRMVMSISHDILVLNNGQWIAEGDAKHVSTHPDVLAAYLGEEEDA